MFGITTILLCHFNLDDEVLELLVGGRQSAFSASLKIYAHISRQDNNN